MKLPRFLRHAFVAVRLFWKAEESGGLLYDYGNGRWKELARWDTDDGSDEAMGLVGDMLNNSRDNIYIAAVKCVGFGRGYLVVVDSNCHRYTRCFWMGIYEPEEAFEDVKRRCRMIADQMGFRKLTQQELENKI